MLEVRGCAGSPERTSLASQFPVNREFTGKNYDFQAYSSKKDQIIGVSTVT